MRPIPDPLHGEPCPGKVIGSLQTQSCLAEAGEEDDYAILEDGSVWVWSHWDASFLNLSRSFESIAAGCLVGLLPSIAVLSFVWLKKRAA